MKGKTLCALGEFATSPVTSTIRHFMPEYKAKVDQAMADAGSVEVAMAD